MNEIDQEQKLQARVRRALDVELESLDPAITCRLQECRRRAVEQIERKPFSLLTVPRLIPVGGATLAVAALTVSLWYGMRPQPVPNKAADEIEVLTVQGNLEMYKELDFFQMLAQTHESR